MATLQCELCSLEFPVECFPDFDKGLVCEYCLAGEDAANAQQKLMAKTKEMADAILDVQGVDDLMPKIKTVMAEVYAGFGGPRGFAAKVVWVIDELCKRRPIPASAGQLLINLMKLHQSVESSDQASNLADMSLEQLRREQELAMMQLAIEASGDRHKREMLFAMLGRQGFQVTRVDPAERHDNLVRTVNAEDFAAQSFISQQNPSQGQNNVERSEPQPNAPGAPELDESGDAAGGPGASRD